MVYGEVGDIWRFEAPSWDRRRFNSQPVEHYLILEVSCPLTNLYYTYCLETGKYVEDLIIDESNFRNYNAHKVA
jgi:hypothetical protein